MRTIHTERIHVGTQYAFKRIPAIGEAVDPDDLELVAAGGGDGDFSSYALIYNNVLTECYNESPQAIYVGTNGRTMMITAGYYMVIIEADGTLSVVDVKTQDRESGRRTYDSSDGGKYQVFFDYYNELIAIYKDGAFLQNWEHVMSDFEWSSMCVAMSSDGKYVAVAARDMTGGLKPRLALLQGS